MKTRKELEEDYKNYQAEASFDELEVFLGYIDYNLDELEDSVALVKKEKRKIKLERIANFFLQEKPDFYYQELDKLYHHYVRVEIEYFNLFVEMQEKSTEENYTSMLRLLEYGIDMHNEVLDYYFFMEKSLEVRSNGINCISNPTENHEEEYLEFLYQMIAEYAKEKAVEKKIIM